MEFARKTDFPAVLAAGAANFEAAGRRRASQTGLGASEDRPVPAGDEKMFYTAARRTGGRASITITGRVATITREKPGGLVKFYNNLDTLKKRRAWRDKWVARLTLGRVRRRA